MNLNVNDGNEIKIGTRVPVEPKQGEFQYIDLGTNIWSKLEMRNGQPELAVRTEVSNFAIPEQSRGRESRPLIRQLKINASTLALLGKPTVVGSVDDPNSKRQFQVEVTVTKLRQRVRNARLAAMRHSAVRRYKRERIRVGGELF